MINEYSLNKVSEEKRIILYKQKDTMTVRKRHKQSSSVSYESSDNKVKRQNTCSKDKRHKSKQRCASTSSTSSSVSNCASKKKMGMSDNYKYSKPNYSKHELDSTGCCSGNKDTGNFTYSNAYRNHFCKQHNSEHIQSLLLHQNKFHRNRHNNTEYLKYNNEREFPSQNRMSKTYNYNRSRTKNNQKLYCNQSKSHGKNFNTCTEKMKKSYKERHTADSSRPSRSKPDSVHLEADGKIKKKRKRKNVESETNRHKKSKRYRSHSSSSTSSCTSSDSCSSSSSSSSSNSSTSSSTSDSNSSSTSSCSTSNSSSSTTSFTSNTSTTDSLKDTKRQKKGKSKNKKSKTTIKKRRTKKKIKVQLKKSAKNKQKREKLSTHVENLLPDITDKAKAMAPMTKEEWEKRQSIIRKVYDKETGRYRLIKGDGEVLEEIVSREQHRQINKQATKGDGEYFQAHLKLNIV